MPIWLSAVFIIFIIFHLVFRWSRDSEPFSEDHGSSLESSTFTPKLWDFISKILKVPVVEIVGLNVKLSPNFFIASHKDDCLLVVHSDDHKSLCRGQNEIWSKPFFVYFATFFPLTSALSAASSKDQVISFFHILSVMHSFTRNLHFVNWFFDW